MQMRCHYKRLLDTGTDTINQLGEGRIVNKTVIKNEEEPSIFGCDKKWGTPSLPFFTIIKT